MFLANHCHYNLLLPSSKVCCGLWCHNCAKIIKAVLLVKSCSFFYCTLSNFAK